MAVLPSNMPEVSGSDMYLGPLVTQLLLCLCEAASAAPNPPAICTLRIGNDAPHDLGTDDDFCCQGFAYVTILDAFPSAESFPNQDLVRQANANCPPPTWAVTLRAALVRCAPTGGENGVVISNAAWEEAALQNIYDLRTLQRTACCFRDFVINQSNIMVGMSVVIDRFVQGNAFGGCVERSVNLTVQVPNCDC